VKALTVEPGDPASLRLEDLAEPIPEPGHLLIEVLLTGICGTDHEIIEGDIGYPPPGRDRLVLGHEAVGRVVQPADDSGLAAGDLIAPIVRRPDPIPCPNCAIGEWDMCQNGRFVEAGIRGLDGYASEMITLSDDFAVPLPSGLGDLGVLVEPASVVAKAWEHILRIGSRARWEPGRCLVTGAGPIGLLAALFATDQCEQVHVLDRASEGPKPTLARDLGATYHHEGLESIDERFDVVVECTGDVGLMMEAPSLTRPNGIVCLAGVADEGSTGAAGFARDMVLENRVVFGTVNANRRHYEEAAKVLGASDRPWLERLVDRRMSIEHWKEAYERDTDAVKTVIEFLPPGAPDPPSDPSGHLPLRGRK
jgi:threonine dehydrogenase-like Zn-dependent dehydrogenase